MYTWKQVSNLLDSWKKQNLKAPDISVKLANACLGWAYVFGARGEQCTPQNRRAYYASKGKPTIKSKCKNFNGDKGCSGCQWYPGGTTLFYDCRGFTYWVFLKAAGIKINGAGATSQYDDDNNWSEKGPIANMPRDKVCCVFRYDSGTRKMEHTLIYDGQGNYIHDSGTVKKTAMSKYGATHYAIPKGLYGDSPTPPTPPEPTPGTAIVTGKNVALREGPSTSTKVITRIVTGTTVKIAKQPIGWAYVFYGSRVGFMMSSFIQNLGDGTYKVTGKNVALRNGPSTSTTVLARIATGQKVKEAKQPSGWEYISFGPNEGFMMKEFLKE